MASVAMQVQEKTLDNIKFPDIPKGFIAVDALNESSKKNDFKDTYLKFLNDIERETVPIIDPVLENHLDNIKRLINHHWDHSSEINQTKLSQLMKKLINKLTQLNCKKTTHHVLTIIAQIKSTTFESKLTNLQKILKTLMTNQ